MKIEIKEFSRTRSERFTKELMRATIEIYPDVDEVQLVKFRSPEWLRFFCVTERRKDKRTTSEEVRYRINKIRMFRSLLKREMTTLRKMKVKHIVNRSKWYNPRRKDVKVGKWGSAKLDRINREDLLR